MEDIDPGQRDLLYQLFQTLDTAKAGYLTPQQMRIAVESQGFQPDLPEDVEQYDFPTFCAQFKVTSRPKDQEETLKRLLVCLDRDFDGNLRMEEVQRVINDPELCSRVFDELNVHDSDVLSIDDFCRRLYRL